MARRSDGPRLTEYRRLALSIVMGLDQHRAQITAEWLDTDTGELSRRRVSPADRAGVRAFAACFAEQDLDVALEATTGWRFAAQELAAVGARVHLAEPAESAALRGTKRRAKTDRADAKHLRELLAAGRLPESWIPPEHLLELRARVRLFITMASRPGHGCSASSRASGSPNCSWPATRVSRSPPRSRLSMRSRRNSCRSTPRCATMRGVSPAAAP
jgi:hypothetical protein